MQAIFDNESNVNLTYEKKLNKTEVFLLRDEAFDAFVVVFFCVVGFFGHCSAIKFIRKAENRGPPQTILINFVIADLLQLVSFLPMFINQFNAPERSLFGDIVCKTIECSNELVIAAAMITLITLNLFSFYDVPEPPATFLNRFVKSNITVVVSSIWGLAAIIAFPMVLISHLFFFSTHDYRNTECETFLSGHLYGNAIIRITVYYVIPIVTSAYLFVMAVLNKKRKGYAQNKSQKEFSKVVFVMIVATALFFSPPHIFGLLLSYYNKEYNLFWTNYYNTDSSMNFIFRTFNTLALSYIGCIFLVYYMKPVLCGKSGNEEPVDENGIMLVDFQPLDGIRGVVPGPEQPLQQGA